jgi:hypothetical protein
MSWAIQNRTCDIVSTDWRAWEDDEILSAHVKTARWLASA